jgi:hypothetical protein
MSSAPSRSPESQGVGRELVGEELPELVQASPAARLHRLLGRVVRVAIPALRIVEDADAGIAVGGDVDQAADLLRPPRRLGGEQAALGMDQAEVDQDRRDLAQDAAVLEDQGRDLRQRIDPLQLLEAGRLVPRCGLDLAVGDAGDVERDLGGGRARSLRTVENGHHGIRIVDPIVLRASRSRCAWAASARA